MYFYYFQKSRNVMFSGTVSDYLFIYVFLLFPEVQKCYVFRHCARLFVYLCISIISRSPEILCFQALCMTGSSQWSVFETDITMSWINTNTVNKHFFASSVTHRSTSRYIVDQIVWWWIEKAIWESLYHDILIWWTKCYCSCEYTRVLYNYSCLAKCRKVSSFLVFWKRPPYAYGLLIKTDESILT